MPVWDLSAASYDSVNFAPTGTWGFTFQPDGTAFFTADRGFGSGGFAAKVRKYTMSTPWDLSTASLSQTYTATQIGGAFNDVEFNDDGTKMYLLDQGGPAKIFQYTLTTGYDLSTASYASKSLDVSATVPGAQHMVFKPDGTKVWVTNQSTVYEFTLSTPWDISTGSYASKSYNNAARDAQTNSTFFKSDGTRMWMIGAFNSGNPGIYQFDLSTAWDVTTASFVGDLHIGSRDTSPRDLYISPNGTKLYFIGTATNKAYQYTLGVLGGWQLGMALNQR
jgi:hypothetical protein